MTKQQLPMMIRIKVRTEYERPSDDRLGILKAYERIHKDAGEEAKATAEDEKIAIVEKALAALK